MARIPSLVIWISIFLAVASAQTTTRVSVDSNGAQSDLAAR